jgi:hypothetical protein
VFVSQLVLPEVSVWNRGLMSPTQASEAGRMRCSRDSVNIRTEALTVCSSRLNARLKALRRGCRPRRGDGSVSSCDAFLRNLERDIGKIAP